MSVASEVTTIENDALNAVRPLVARIQLAAKRYLVHAAGQAIALFTVATHDVSKWQASVAVLATAVGTNLLKRIGAWAAAVKA